MIPKISVIIPYYNGIRWLPVSVGGVLAQEGVDLELLVVDDGSSVIPDINAAYLRDPRVKLLRIDHAGKGAAINAGVRAAAGDVICILDQDDRMLAGRLARQLAALAAEPSAAAVYSDYERVEENGGLIDVFVSRQASGPEMLHTMARSISLISMQTMMVRKKAIERLGGFSEDPALNGMDDGDFFVRLIGSGMELIYMPGTVSQWVRHGENFSSGPQFQAVRLAFLKRLETLVSEYPLIRAELSYFRAHEYSMRGLYCLEHGDFKGAAPELMEAFKARPFDLNVVYLLFKAKLFSVAGRK